MILVCLMLVLVPLLAAAPAAAKTTRGARDTAGAYGTRLNNPADPTVPLNTRRYNNRIDNRMQSRVQLHLERFRANAAADPVATYERGAQSATQAIERVDSVERRAKTGR